MQSYMVPKDLQNEKFNDFESISLHVSNKTQYFKRFHKHLSCTLKTQKKKMEGFEYLKDNSQPLSATFLTAEGRRSHELTAVSCFMR